MQSDQNASAPSTAARPEDAEILNFEQHQLTVAEAEAYRRAAVERAVAQNDLMIRDLLLAIDDWNRLQGAASGAACRVNVPVNVRGREGADIPASNRLGFAFVTVSPREFGDREKLLQIVHAQTEQIKQWKLALYFLGGLGHGHDYSRRRGRQLALEEIIRHRRVEQYRPADGAFAPAAQRRTAGLRQRGAGEHHRRAAHSSQHAGRHYSSENTAAEPRMSLRCEPRLFNAAQTRALLDTYVARLRETAAEAVGQSPSHAESTQT